MMQNDRQMAESKEAFMERFGMEGSPIRENISLLCAKQDDPTEQIFVFFPDDAKVGVKTIKTFVERMKSEGVKRSILVVQQGLTPFAKTCLSEMQPRNHIEVVRMYGIRFHPFLCKITFPKSSCYVLFLSLTNSCLHFFSIRCSFKSRSF